MVKYIIENDLPKKMVDSQPIIKALDSNGNEIRMVIYLLTESVNIMLKFLETNNFERDISNYFAQCKFGPLSSIFYEILQLDPDQFPSIKGLDIQITANTKMMRIFLFLEFAIIPKELNKEDCMADFAEFLKESFANYIESLSRAEILAYTAFDALRGIYNRGDGIFSDALFELPDIELIFDRSKFNNDFKKFAYIVKEATFKDFIYNTMVDQETGAFKITLLHPGQALIILKTELKLYEPEIIGLNNAKPISLDQLKELASRFGEYSPQFELFDPFSKSIVTLFADKKRKARNVIIEEEFL